MTLERQLQQTLDGWPMFQQGEATVAVEHEGARLTCVLTALDSLACAFLSLTLDSDKLRGAKPERLQAIAAALAKRLTYLLEPINPIETDIERSVVQMRSTPPRKADDRTDYYELLVTRAGELSLRRYSHPKGGQRSMIAAQVTREVLARLAGDLAAAI